MNELATLLKSPDLAEKLGVDKVRLSQEATIQVEGVYVNAFQDDLTLVAAMSTINGKRAQATLPLPNDALFDPDAKFDFEGEGKTALVWLKEIVAKSLAGAVADVAA
jgi:hypothetical protein